jgi:hypothetical protein
LAKRVDDLAEQVKKAQGQLADLLKAVAEKRGKEGQAPAVADPSKAAGPADAKNQNVVQNPDSRPGLDTLENSVNKIQQQLNQLQKMLAELQPSPGPFKPKLLAELTKDLKYTHAASSKTGKVGPTSTILQQELGTISLNLEASRQSARGLQSRLRSATTQLAVFVRERDAKYLEWYKAQNDQAEAVRKASTQEDIDEKNKKVDELARAKGELDRKVEETQKQIINLIQSIQANESDVGKLTSDRTTAGLVQDLLRASAGATVSAYPE